MKSDNVYDKKQVVEEFEKIRDVFEDIQTKITLKQARVHGYNHLYLNQPVSGPDNQGSAYTLNGSL